MTIPRISNWSPKALLLGTSAIIGGFVGIVTGFAALAEYQPFATKQMLVAQSMAMNESVEALRWDQLSYGIDSLQFQIGQKQFQIIQLGDSIEVDPADQFKRQALERLNSEIEKDENRLERMRCQYEQRDRPNAAACP